MSVSTGRTEDAGNLGEEDCSRGLPQPSADEMPSLQMAPPGRHPGRSRNDRDTSLSKTQTDNESERPRKRYIGTRSGVQDTLCEASGGGDQVTLKELTSVLGALESGSSEWYAVIKSINRLKEQSENAVIDR